MKCQHCGNEFEGNFCSRCGCPVTSQPNQTQNNQFSRMLIEQDEKVVAVLGNNLAQTFLATGKIGKGFSVLSNKRLYIKGNCLMRKGKAMFIKKEEKTVDLNDITGIGFIYNKAAWLLIPVLLFLLASMALALNAIVGHEELWEPLVACGFGAGVFYLVYRMFNYSAFEIAYAGGCIAFDLRWIREGDAQEFQRQVVVAKQSYKTIEKENDLFAVSKTVPQQLKEYKELLDNGVITPEEFEIKKKQLLRL